MSVKLLTEYHLEFLSLKGGCTGSSESTLVKMPHCWHMSRLIFFLSDSLLCVMSVQRLYKGLQIGSVRIQQWDSEDSPELHDVGFRTRLVALCLATIFG